MAKARLKIMNKNIKTKEKDAPQEVALPSADGQQPPTPAADTCFQPAPGETPRAFAAFMAFFNLGHGRSHKAVAERLTERLPTVKHWSSKYAWADRIRSFNSGLLRSSAREQVAIQSKINSEWADRIQCLREEEWDASRKLNAAAKCFLESFGDEELGKMNLDQVSRAVKISSEIGRQAVAGASLPASTEPEMSPIQQQLLRAVEVLYGQKESSSEPSSSEPSSSSSSSNPETE